MSPFTLSDDYKSVKNIMVLNKMKILKKHVTDCNTEHVTDRVTQAVTVKLKKYVF